MRHRPASLPRRVVLLAGLLLLTGCTASVDTPVAVNSALQPAATVATLHAETPATGASPTPTSLGPELAVASSSPSPPPITSAARPAGTQIDLLSALLPRDIWLTPSVDRESDSGIYDHNGRWPSEDCAGLRRGQQHVQERFAMATDSWVDRGIIIEQQLADFGDHAVAATHMELFTRMADDCAIAVMRCTDCRSDANGIERTYEITPWDPGVVGAVGYAATQLEDGSAEWWVRYQRDEVVATLRFRRLQTEPWPERTADLEEFERAVASMAASLDAAVLRNRPGPWPEPFVIDEFTIELVSVDENDDDDSPPWIDYSDYDESPRTYAAINGDDAMTDSVSLLLFIDPHDPEDADYTLGDYSYFDADTTVGGRQAIWEPWFDEDREHSRGFQLIWDASPDAYGFMQSRTLGLDEMRDIAASLAVSGADFEWTKPVRGMTLVARDLFATEAEDFLERSGQFVDYRVGWETEDESPRADVTLGFFPSLEGEISLLRSLAFSEERVMVRGQPGYLLEIFPASQTEDGTTYLVWQEDEATIAIATIDDHRAAHLLPAIADSFDRARPYD